MFPAMSTAREQVEISNDKESDVTPTIRATSVLQRIIAYLFAPIPLCAFGLTSTWLFTFFLICIIYLILHPLCERIFLFLFLTDEDDYESPKRPPHPPYPLCLGHIAPKSDTVADTAQQPRRERYLRRKVLTRNQRVQQGENWRECNSLPTTLILKVENLPPPKVRELMGRMRLRLEEAQRLQQQERDGVLIINIDRSKNLWDFNNTARSMMSNSWFSGIRVSMPCKALQQEHVKMLMVLPMTFETTNMFRRAITAAAGLASVFSSAPTSPATTEQLSANGGSASGTGGGFSYTLTAVKTSTSDLRREDPASGLVRYHATKTPRFGSTAFGTSSTDSTSDATGTPPRHGASWLYTTSAHSAALEFFHTLPEVEKAFYSFFLQFHQRSQATYNGHKAIWDGFADDFPFNNSAFARKYATWESCVADLGRMPFLREMYGVHAQYDAYMDFKKAKKAFEWCDAALKDTVLPEIQRAVKWDREFEDRRTERESKASRVIFIVDEDPRTFSEYKTEITQTSTPIIERPDPSPTHNEYLATSSDRLPGSLMSSWHMEGDSLDPVLIRAAASQGVAPPRCTPKVVVDCVREEFENMISKELNILRGLHWEKILHYHSMDPMNVDEDTQTEDDEEVQSLGSPDEGQNSEATRENQQANDGQAGDSESTYDAHGEKRARPPVWGDGYLMYLEPRKRVRFNSNLPDRPIGKCDTLGHAPMTEYNFQVEGYHSLAAMLKDILGFVSLNYEWDHDVKMLAALEPGPVHTTMMDADRVVEITPSEKPESRSERLLRLMSADARMATSVARKRSP